MISFEKIKELRNLLYSLYEGEPLISYNPFKSRIKEFVVYISHPLIIDDDWYAYEHSYEQLQAYLDDGFKIARIYHSDRLPGDASGYWVTVVKEDKEDFD